MNSSLARPVPAIPLLHNSALNAAFLRIEGGVGFKNGSTSSYSDSTGEPGYSDYSDYSDCPAED